MNSVSGKTFPTINPATGKKIADIAEGDKVYTINLANSSLGVKKACIEKKLLYTT